MAITSLEFKTWLENCFRDARAQGLPDEAILLELLEQTRFMLAMWQLRIEKSIETTEEKCSTG